MLSPRKARLTLRFEASGNGYYDKHLDLLQNGNNNYPELVTALQQISWHEFKELFYRVGEVTAIYNGDQYAGFYWVEVRGRVLHLHSLFIENGYRGRGIGKKVLDRLENIYCDTLDVIELGLHESNERGLEFFLREGFEKQDFVEDVGFIILRKPLRGLS